MVNIKEIQILKRLITEKLDVRGQCKMFSVALGKVDKCQCALCQVDDMNSFRLLEEITFLSRTWNNNMWQRRAIEEAVPKWLCYLCNTPLIGWDDKNESEHHIYCPNGSCGVSTPIHPTLELAEKEYLEMRKNYIENIS